MARVRLLLADVDGTLVTKEKVLTSLAAQAVAELGHAGIRFAITSGRPPRGMAMLFDALKLDTLIAGFNGGVFVRPDLSIVEQRSLAADAAHEALDSIRAQGLDAWVYTGAEWMVLKQDAPHVAREAWTVKFDPKVVQAFSDDDLADAVKIVGVSDDLELVAACEKKVQAALGDRVSAARSQPYYLDVTHPDANKGAVVRALSHQLGIPASEIATIGDMPNDVLMFRESGVSIAMGNASDEVKQAATDVTDSNEDEGFASAVRKFVLGRG